MSYTATTIFGRRLEERLSPWLDPAGDLARLCDAIGAMFQPVLSLAEESGEDGTAGYIPAWGTLLEVKRVPAVDLPFLGQLVGVEVTKGATETEARKQVEREAGLERGTTKSIEEAIKSVIGASPFVIQERTAKGGGAAPYHFNVLVGTGKNSKALEEAIESVKPGGVMFSVLEVKNAWIQGTKRWNEVAAGKKWTETTEGTY